MSRKQRHPEHGRSAPDRPAELSYDYQAFVAWFTHKLPNRRIVPQVALHLAICHVVALRQRTTPYFTVAHMAKCGAKKHRGSRSDIIAEMAALPNSPLICTGYDARFHKWHFHIQWGAWIKQTVPLNPRTPGPTAEHWRLVRKTYTRHLANQRETDLLKRELAIMEEWRVQKAELMADLQRRGEQWLASDPTASRQLFAFIERLKAKRIALGIPS